MRDDVQLNVVPYPATFKENEGSYSVGKTGYLSFEFLPFTQQAGTGNDQTVKNRPDTTRRKVMIVSMKNIRDLINLDTAKVADTEQPLNFIQYQPNTMTGNPENTRVVNFAKAQGKEAYDFSYCEVDQSQNIVGEVLKTSLTFQEL